MTDIPPCVPPSDTTWQRPAPMPPLEPGEIHVWRTALNLPDSHRHALAAVLSPEEHHRAEKIHFRRHRERFVVARGVLRRLLGHYSQSAPERIRLAYGDRGKPFVAGNAGGELCFNLSHSRGLCVYAFVSGTPVGIDVEYLNRRTAVDGIARRFFSPEEYDVLSALPPHRRQTAFLACWTVKEAYLKATGQGLAGLEGVAVALNSAGRPELTRIDGSDESARDWRAYAFAPRNETAAALVVKARPWQLRFFEWC